jgi:ribonuclease E
VSKIEETPADTLLAQPATEETAPDTPVLPFPAATATSHTEISDKDEEARDSTSHLASPGEKRETRETRETKETEPQPSSVIELPEPIANGLVMVETIPEKIKQSESKAEAESTLPQRRRKRPHPVPPASQDEPMVQIETHSK